MKKLIALLLTASMIFVATGCGDNTENTENTGSTNITKFANFKLLESKRSFSDCDEKIYVDLNTGVLYYVQSTVHQRSMTPILKADGKPLTLAEFNENQAINSPK